MKDEYESECRVRRRDGQWRWFIGRARPLRNEQGSIIRWFGTLTDINESIEAREAANRTREQLLRVIETAKVSIWSVNMDRIVTMLEGSLMWQAPGETTIQAVGLNIYEIFGGVDEGQRAAYIQPVEDVLTGRSSDETTEMEFASNNRFYQTRYVPLLGTTRKAGCEPEVHIDGVIGVSMDITELRKREQDLRTQEKENSKLLANALAAKEASRMKSQFLANVSRSGLLLVIDIVQVVN